MEFLQAELAEISSTVCGVSSEVTSVALRRFQPFFCLLLGLKAVMNAREGAVPLLHTVVCPMVLRYSLSQERAIGESQGKAS